MEIKIKTKNFNVRNKHSNRRGFTIVEAIVYSAGLVLLVGTIVGFLYYMYNWYQYATISSKVDQIGLTIMDRIVRDIRTGTDINLSQSSFNSATGWIFINARENGIDTTKRFGLENGRIDYEHSDGTDEYLTPENMSASRLLFTHIDTGVSEAVRAELQITYNTRQGPVTHDFYGLAILRQSYE